MVAAAARLLPPPENHIAHIFAKLGASTRTGAVVAAIAAGLVTLDKTSST